MEASYGKEPFDLRLEVLYLCRNLWKILAVTVLGTVLFGGGYYVKNVLLQPDPGYAASSTYKVEYFENPNAAGAYYINEATWNSLIHTGEFLDGVETHLQEAADRGETKAAEVLAMGRESISSALSATLPSDFSIPVTKVTLQEPAESVALAAAVEETMCNEFAETIAEIRLIKVLDHGGGTFLFFRGGDFPVVGTVLRQHLAAGDTAQTLRTEGSRHGVQCGIC